MNLRKRILEAELKYFERFLPTVEEEMEIIDTPIHRWTLRGEMEKRTTVSAPIQNRNLRG